MIFTPLQRMMGCLLLGGLLSSLPVTAQQYNASGGRGDRGDLDSAVREIRKETGGRVLQAETRSRDGRKEHHVRILTERGKVKRYRVDADSGKRLPRDR